MKKDSITNRIFTAFCFLIVLIQFFYGTPISYIIESLGRNFPVGISQLAYGLGYALVIISLLTSSPTADRSRYHHASIILDSMLLFTRKLKSSTCLLDTSANWCIPHARLWLFSKQAHKTICIFGKCHFSSLFYSFCIILG